MPHTDIEQVCAEAHAAMAGLQRSVAELRRETDLAVIKVNLLRLEMVMAEVMGRRW